LIDQVLDKIRRVAGMSYRYPQNYRLGMAELTFGYQTTVVVFRVSLSSTLSVVVRDPVSVLC